MSEVVEHRNSPSSYIIGFVLSLVLTVIPFILVINDVLSGWILIATLSMFAFAQLLVQLIFFLHFGKESKPRWNAVAFFFMLLVVFIVVVGSIWIMNNLHYNGLSPTETNQYLIDEEAIEP